MTSMFLLMPSPLLGPATWRPVEDWLRGQGHGVTVVDFGSAPRTPAAVVNAVAAAADDHIVTLVPHSNAGLYAPYLSTLVDVEATLFVDAALPPLELDQGQTPLAPPASVDFLRDLADEEGDLPPWTEWWGGAVDDLFPDADVRRQVEYEQQRLPLSYFTNRIPVPNNWTVRPASYLALGHAYADELERAVSLGWPTRAIPGHHLYPLEDPVTVGRLILDLRDEALR